MMIKVHFAFTTFRRLLSIAQGAGDFQSAKRGFCSSMINLPNENKFLKSKNTGEFKSIYTQLFKIKIDAFNGGQNPHFIWGW